MKHKRISLWKHFSFLFSSSLLFLPLCCLSPPAPRDRPVYPSLDMSWTKWDMRSYLYWAIHSQNETCCGQSNVVLHPLSFYIIKVDFLDLVWSINYSHIYIYNIIYHDHLPVLTVFFNHIIRLWNCCGVGLKSLSLINHCFPFAFSLFPSVCSHFGNVGSVLNKAC